VSDTETEIDWEARADEELTAQLDDGVLWLTINRAQSGNAIPFYVRDRLIKTFTEAHSDLAVRCIVLTAAGERHFCTGADLTIRPPAVGRKVEGAPDQVTAAGGGSMLVLAADLVIAADNARLIQVFVRRGLVPDGGVAYLLPRIVGLHKAKELVFFGDDLGAADMERLGIANKVVPQAELESATREWALRLAQGPTKAIGWAKKMLHDASEIDRRALLEEEAMFVELNSHTHDGSEGTASFRERRPPEFKGW